MARRSVGWPQRLQNSKRANERNAEIDRLDKPHNSSGPVRGWTEPPGPPAGRAPRRYKGGRVTAAYQVATPPDGIRTPAGAHDTLSHPTKRKGAAQKNSLSSPAILSYR